MRGLLTRDERMVIAFIAAATAIGALVLGLRRVDPSLVPDLAPADGSAAIAGTLESGAGERMRLGGESTGPVDVNSATADELTRLPGIGPAKARAIVTHRERHGRFVSLDALLDVSGIGPATLERLRPMATLGGAEATTEHRHREGR